MSKPRFRMPHVFTLLTIIIFICSLFTYIIPSGSFERETKEIGGTQRTLVVPGTFKEIPKHISFESVTIGETVEGKATPVGLRTFLTSIPRGMEKTADIIFFIFVVGGVFSVLTQTGLIATSLHKLVDVLGGSAALVTVVVMVLLAIGGSLLGMGEEFIPLVPVFLLLSKKLGYDRIYALALVELSAAMGFAAATTNPFTVGVAQGIAEVPLTSGWQFRSLFFVVIITVTIGYVLRYGARMKKDRSNSLMADDPFDVSDIDVETGSFTGRHGAALLVSVLIFAGILVAVPVLGWWLTDMSGGFLLIGIAVMAIMGMSIRDGMSAFVKGLEGMVVAALVVGVARGIEVVLSDGQILDTLIHHAATVLQTVPKHISVLGMLVFQSSLNFLIPSGSGQAAVTMPLMSPLADVLGITRQTAVFAFQCGDGFSNTIVPTSGILMAMLGLAKIPYDRWLRFVLPLFLVGMVISAIFLMIAVRINYQ